MLLYFLRHGDAVDHPSYHDAERPLSPLGVRQAEIVAAFLKSSRQPLTRILSSPLARAKETASIVQHAFRQTPVETTEALASGSDPKHVIALLDSMKDEGVLLVGHEPHLSATMSMLVAGDTRARIQMKKASLACVELPIPIKRTGGTLKWLIAAELLIDRPR
jgi:phosphohistidine phosphatase